MPTSDPATRMRVARIAQPLALAALVAALGLAAIDEWPATIAVAVAAGNAFIFGVLVRVEVAAMQAERGVTTDA